MKGNLYVFGVTPSSDNILTTLVARSVMVSSDAGVTWTALTYSDSNIIPHIDSNGTAFYMGNATAKMKISDQLFKYQQDYYVGGNGADMSTYYVNLFDEAILVKTNNSAVSPTVTTTYTRVV